MSRESLFRAVWRQNRTVPLLIVVLLGINLVAYALLATLVWPQLAEQERTFIGLQSQVRAGRADLPQSPQELLRQAQADSQRFRASLPARKDFPALIDDFSELAQETGVKVGSISYQPKELSDQALLEYQLQFSITGDYGATKRFLQELEDSSRLIVLESITAAASTTDGNVAQVTLNLRMMTYFRSDEP